MLGSPGSRPGSRGPTGLVNWTARVELEPQTQIQTKEDGSCLTGLSEEEASLCRQLQEMDERMRMKDERMKQLL